MIFPLLSGEFPPTFIHKSRGQYLFAFKGYSVDINCQVNDTLAQVELLQDVRGKGTLTRVPDDVKVTQSGQIFTIKDVQSSDKGLCWCRIKKERTWVLRAETLYPLTAKKNYILSQDVTPPSISIKEGESASFVCKAGGSRIRSIEWYKDKLKVPDRYVVYNNTKDHKISTIQLPAVTVAQGGMYECRTSVKVSGGIKIESYKSQSAMLFVTAFHFLAKQKKIREAVCGGQCHNQLQN
ncbi:PREDICTED: uncharacterized protein LOC107355150 [Acropora digitifera]|uniref:uncharacterized protein LOC107355150 n=1 Tax=Acropora digitifera TaxID=70779 RepID=UPI00077AA4C1|nr:PREDICTED: uncharacterized protein LOC107355150 [Acropora digitifera]